MDKEARTVTFTYRDYADGSQIKGMKFDVNEFVRRFRLHILPKRFVKIRHYGILSNRNRTVNIEKARKALGVKEAPVPKPQETGEADDETYSRKCPFCDSSRIVLVMKFNRPSFKQPRPPP